MSARSEDAYFDARADAFDRLYDVRGGLHGLLYRPLLERLAWTLAECGEVAGLRVADLGCGSGRYTVEIAARGAHVVGVDRSEQMLALARSRARRAGLEHRCTFLREDIEHFTVEEPFDIAVSIGVLDYLADPLPHLRRVAALTRGRAILSYPRPLAWRSALRRLRYLPRTSGPRFHTHARRGIAAGLAAAGFAECRFRPGWVVAVKPPPAGAPDS